MEQLELFTENQPLPVAPVIGSFYFTIRDTECNSKVFGDCEICNKPAVQVFHQKRFQNVIHPLRKKIYQKFISDSYGHKQCLESLR